jgi:hypothetical protein
MSATICARIQIDEQDIGYIMKIVEHLLFYDDDDDVFINKTYKFVYILFILRCAVTQLRGYFHLGKPTRLAPIPNPAPDRAETARLGT